MAEKKMVLVKGRLRTTRWRSITRGEFHREYQEEIWVEFFRIVPDIQAAKELIEERKKDLKEVKCYELIEIQLDLPGPGRSSHEPYCYH